MKFALRLVPLAAIGAALAMMISIFGSQAAGNNADSFAIDTDTAGNDATTLGTRNECKETAAGDTVTVDVTATNVPAGNPMLGFAFKIDYDESALSFVFPRNFDSGLLSTAPGYSGLGADDALPDTDGAYRSAVADLAAQGASGSGYLERLTVKVADGAAAGGYALTLTEAAHNDLQNISRVPDAIFGARIAVGVTCASLGEPTPSPAPDTGLQGDVDCTDVVNSVDSLKVLRFVAGLNVIQTEPCDDINTGGPPLQGDVDCSGTVNSVDALKILRFVAGLSVIQTEPCDDINT